MLRPPLCTLLSAISMKSAAQAGPQNICVRLSQGRSQTQTFPLSSIFQPAIRSGVVDWHSIGSPTTRSLSIDRPSHNCELSAGQVFEKPVPSLLNRGSGGDRITDLKSAFVNKFE